MNKTTLGSRNVAMNAMDDGTFAEAIQSFILRELLQGERVERVAIDVDLLKTGVLDSLSVIHLVDFLEAQTGLVIGGQELTPDNIGSVSKIVAFVRRRLNATTTAATATAA